MTLWLNAYPISFEKNAKIKVCEAPFSYPSSIALRNQYSSTHAFYRIGDRNICVSIEDDEEYPITGKIHELEVQYNLGLFSFLIKKRIIRVLQDIRSNAATDFYPIKVISAKPEDNLLKEIVPSDFPFQINCKYELDIRNIEDALHLVIDCSTGYVTTKSCKYFNEQSFNLVNRYIISDPDNNASKLLGKILEISGNKLSYQDKEGKIQTIDISLAFLEPNRKNFDDYTKHHYGTTAKVFLEKIRITVSRFNSGAIKKDKIERFKKFVSSKIKTVAKINVDFLEAKIITASTYRIDKTLLLFSDNFETHIKDGDYGGLKKTGPYTRRTFDRNDPHICVICTENNKGQVEQFITKFLKGIPNHKYFSTGLEGKFQIGTSKVEIFVLPDNTIKSYKSTIECAIQKKTSDGGKWDLALVQVEAGFKDLEVEKNPYYIAKSLFLLHQVPVQDFTVELTMQGEDSLGYSLNNMALATYAKIGGIPWLLKSSPTLSHEIVIGIGSAILFETRLVDSQKIMGITTVFTGDGSYIVANTSKAVSPERYPESLIQVLEQTIDKIKLRLNWQDGDTIRIIFHASVKKFNKDEIAAVKKVIANYPQYNIEYSFLKISEQHGLCMFDSSTAQESKGKYAPLRGQAYSISASETLLYLIGQKELKQTSDGHPRGLILSVHKDSTFRDIKYLSRQLFNFSAHSWRSYFPSHMPVTIAYSDLIAHNLGWLNKISGWNDTVMHGKIGQTQWFL